MHRISRVPGVIGTVLGPLSTCVESAGGNINKSVAVDDWSINEKRILIRTSDET